MNWQYNSCNKVAIDDIKRMFPAWNRYYRKFIPKDKTIKILDIGCGYGEFIYYLKNIGYKDSYGIDIDPRRINFAKDAGIMEVEHTDAISFLKDKKNKYDVVIARDSIEHFSKDRTLELLSSIFSSLRAERGILIIQTPNGESPLAGRYRYWDFTHEVIFTQNSLKNILSLAGFKKTECFPAGPVPLGLASSVRFFFWKIIDALLHFYILVETGSAKGIFTQNMIAVAIK